MEALVASRRSASYDMCMVILDIETTGLDPETHGLLSIGAIDFTRPRDTFYGECRIRRGEKVSQSALEVNGFTADEVKDPEKQSTEELIKSFELWMNRRNVKVIGGLHIASFDVPFLVTKAKQVKASLKLHKRSIDLHSLAYAKMLQLGRIVPLTDGWSVMDVDFIYPFCGLPREPKPKNALNGAKWEAECLARLIYGRKLLKSFERYEVPDYLLVK
jgi:DNA polymerase III epsilon subunit-like protein